MDNKKNSGLKRGIAIALMGAVCLTAAVSVTAMSKTVTVTDGDKTVTVTTLSSDTESMLERTGITLGENDKIVCTENSESSMNISVMRAFSVNIIDGQDKKTLTLNDGTVADAIKAAGLTLSKSDSVSLSQNTRLEPDMEITIARFFTVNIDLKGEKMTKEVPAGTVADALAYLDIKLAQDDTINVKLTDEVSENMDITIGELLNINIDLRGEKLTKKVPSGTVKDTLAYLNIKLDKSDAVNMNLEQEISENADIKISRITYKETTKTESVAYNTVYKNTDSLYKGETSVESNGLDGERNVTLREKYVNGNLISSEEIKSEITQNPVDEVILNGTKEYISQVYTRSGSVYVNESDNILTDVNGNQVSYTRVLTGSATAYYAPAGALTATGRLARYGVVAVDPDIIPYGSILYIVSNDGQVVYGYAVAGDTGGALWAGTAIVDLYYNTYDECCQFGRRNVTIYVLEGVSEDITY